MTTLHRRPAPAPPTRDFADLLARAAVAPGRPTRSVVSPIDQRELARVPQGTADDVAAAVARARTVQPRWAALRPAERAVVALRLHDLLLDRRDELLDLVQLETGKARVGAFEELTDAAMTARYYAHTAERHLRTSRRQGAVPLVATAHVRHVPRGVVGVISPWNYPLTLVASDAVAALLAGNAVVLKPDSRTPLTALAVAGLYADAGLPDGLFQVVPGPGAELGTPLIDAVDQVMFTGSTATGRLVAEQCGRRLIDCTAELGGKNPMLVLADADLDRAVEGAVWACFANAGQLCVSIERIYVEDAVHDAFVAALVERVGRLRVGVGLGWGHDVGSLVSAEQLATVRAHLEDAVAHGARVLVGGRARPDLGPYVHEPTLLAGVTPAMTLHRAETFGPVVAVHRVADEDEAVALANDSEYGLNASVWSTPSHGRRVAARLRAGSVGVNDGYATAWASHDAPIGGVGASGLGRRHGREGIVKYTEPQTVAVQRALSLGPLPSIAHEDWARWGARGARLLRHLPFVD